MDTTLDNSSGMSQPKSEGLAIDVSAIAESAKAKLGEIGGPVKDKALEVASQQKDAGADQLRCAAQAVHGAARELEQSMPQIAGYIHDIGQKLEGFASDLRNGSMDDLLSKLGEFSRNQPALILGSAIFAGFALSRFLKSSAQTSTGAMTSDNNMMGGMQTGSMTMQSGSPQSGMGQDGFSGTGTLHQGRPGGGF
jgi:hypothetical protein